MAEIGPCSPPRLSSQQQPKDKTTQGHLTPTEDKYCLVAYKREGFEETLKQPSNTSYKSYKKDRGELFIECIVIGQGVMVVS